MNEVEKIDPLYRMNEYCAIALFLILSFCIPIVLYLYIGGLEHFDIGQRDTRLWNRANFGKIEPVVSKDSECCKKENAKNTIDINDYIPKPVTQCLDQIITGESNTEPSDDKNFRQWTNSVQKDMEAYNRGERSQSGPNKTFGGLICDNLNGVL